MESFYFTVFGLIFCILLMIIYFPKKKINSLENRVYGVIILVTLFSCLAETYSFILVQRGVNSYDPTYMFSIKLLFSCFLAWIYFFTIYILIVTLDNKNTEKQRQLMKNSILLYLLIVAIDIFFLPITITNVGGMLLPSGTAVNFLYICGSICIIIMFVIFIKNIKDIRNKKFIPLYLLIIMFGIVVLVQKLFPELLTINAAFVFITFVMYFTIENPDVKMIDELNINRLLVSKTVEDKSNFLFLAASQLKQPIKEIIELTDEISHENNQELLQNKIEQVSNVSHNLSLLVNNIMDISSLSYLNIKVVNEKYNLENLIKKIQLLEEKKVNPDVEFRLNVSDTIPKYLYGDSKLLEQVLISLLENAIKYTKKGFIELRINTIAKYDMCRLIFTVEDSGMGMDTFKVNELLMLDENLTEDELSRLNTNNVNMNTIKKLVSKMGGYFTIKSEENKGTEVKIVIDQMIDLKNPINISNYLKQDRVLIASNDKEFLSGITKLVEEYGYSVENSIYANDVIDRIRLKEKFSYIFLDDNLDKRALEVLNELKKDANFKIPVIVIIDESMIIIKDHFIKDGFKDYIIKEKFNKDLERVLK